LQGKIVQRRNLHGNEKEGKKEETLTVRETILAYATNFTGLLREAPLEGLFLLRGFAFLDHKRQGSANLAVLTKIGRDNSAPAGPIESAMGSNDGGNMTRSSLLSAAVAFLTIALASTGCGSNRTLQSVTLTPASADAKNYPNGQVRLVATGTFSKPPSPSPLTSSDVLWCAGAAGACAGNIMPNVTVDQNGVAQCRPGFVGTATVLAGTKSTAMTMPDEGPQLKVFGAAQISCP
jgi:hypothetical protein